MKTKTFGRFRNLVLILSVFIFAVGWGFATRMNTAQAVGVNRYWVGGTGNWSDTGHWSATSGGAGGVSVPTELDNVIIDSSSGFGGGGTITEDDVATQCNNFTSTSGHSYTIETSSSDMEIYGSAVFEPGLTFDSDSYAITQFYGAGAQTIALNGASIFSLDLYGTGTDAITVNGASIQYFNVYGTGNFTLQDNLVATAGLYQENGTFNANNHNVTANTFYFYADTDYTPTVTMGSGTWEATGTGDVWYIDESNGEVVTVNGASATIKLTNAAGGNFNGGGKTYHDIWLAGVATGFVDFYGSNTFSNLKIDAGRLVQFINGSTQTISTFTATGSAGNLITLRGISNANWTERKPLAEDVNKYWVAVSSDSDGSNLIAAASLGRLYTSADSGANWTERRPLGVDANKSWRTVSSDSDGSNLIAAVNGGRLYTSADSGVTWTEQKPAGNVDKYWASVSSDSDGSNLIVAPNSGRLYTSANGGTDWFERRPLDVDTNRDWRAVSSDSDGVHLIAAASPGRLYTSADSGATWTERRPSGEDADKTWSAVSSDSDGSNLIAVVNGGRIYTSANGGVNWTERQPAGNMNKAWTVVSSDSDGSNLIAAVYLGRLYTSADGGVNWIERQPAGSSNGNKDWEAVASDSNGAHLMAGVNSGRLYTFTVGVETGWTISSLSGIISSDYLNIDYSIAAGGASFYAGAHSTDVGHNTGWTFTAPEIDYSLITASDTTSTQTTLTVSENGGTMSGDVCSVIFYDPTQAHYLQWDCSGESSSTLPHSQAYTDLALPVATGQWFYLQFMDSTDLAACQDSGYDYDTCSSSAAFSGEFTVNQGDTSTPDIVAVDAGASSSDRTSLTSNAWFKSSDTGSDDQISFSWTDPSSPSNDTFYYELNSNSGNTITGDESNTAAPFIDSITVAEGTNYFHVRPRNGATTWGTERIFIIKYDKTVPAPNPPSISTSDISASSVTWTLAAGSDSGSNLHTTPYGFATVSGGPYTFQDTAVWVEPDLACGTSYTRYGVIKDAAGNQTSEGSATISTSACTSRSSSLTGSPSSTGYVAATTFTYTPACTAQGGTTLTSCVTQVSTNGGSSWTEISTSQTADQTYTMTSGTDYRFKTIETDSGGAVTSALVPSSGDIQVDAVTPDIVAVDAGASSSDRTSLTSNAWFKYSDTGSDDQISFSWTSPASYSGDTFYYELNVNSGNTITGDESNTAAPFIDSITVAEGTNYFHVRPRNGATAWGTERIFIIKYDKTAPAPNPPTIAASDISRISITWTLAAGSDSGSDLHATPYGFATVSGGPYTFQATSAWVESGLTCNSPYTRYGVIKDAVGNQTSEVRIISTTASCPSSGGVVTPSPTVIYCTSVTYGDYATACFDNYQYRPVTSQLPSDCTLTATQQEAAKRVCIVSETPVVVIEPVPAVSGGSAVGASNPISSAFIALEKSLVEKVDNLLARRLSGRILLQVEEKGESWYVNPVNLTKYYLGRPADAYAIMRALSLGINNKDFDSYRGKAPARLAGRILLKVEDHGEAYYINPIDLKMYYLGRPADAFSLMRTMGLGIINATLRQISVSELK